MNDKIILEESKEVVSKVGNSANDKLKRYIKADMQNNLFSNEKDGENSNINSANKVVNMGKRAAGTVGKIVVKAFGIKAFLFCGLIILAMLIGIIIGAMCSLFGTAKASTPDISEENATKIIQMMEQLDKNCGKNLVSGFKLEGATDTNWKTVLALLLGYYENDLTDFNEALGDGWKNGEISENGLAMIKSFEGFSSTPYDLGDGTMTIGYGTTSKYDPIHYYQLAPKCTELQASMVLQESLKFYSSQVLNQVNKSGRDLSDFTQVHFDALVSFQYNEGSIQDEHFWEMFCNGDSYESIAEQMKNTKIGFGGGVVTRRKAEAHLFATGEYPEVNIYDYGTGTTITTNITGNSSIISKIYNLVNEVSENHGTLTRHDFDEVVEKLNFADDQKEVAEALFEADLWEEVFPEDTNYEFNITGSYTNNSYNLDTSNLSGSRKAIIETGLKMLGKAYLWGGREYDMSKEPENASRVDCSGFTGYLMAKVFGATYYNGPATWTQKEYCYEVPESEALPGDICFNDSCSHTLIYYGKNEQGQNLFMHSPRTGDVIKVSTYSSHVTFWRLKGVNYED